MWTSGPTTRTVYRCIARPGTLGCGSLTVVAEPLDVLVRDAVIHAVSGAARKRTLKRRCRVDEEQARAVRVLADAELAELPTDETAVRAAWDAASVEWRRVLVATALKKVVVQPATRYVFDPDRVELVWRS